MNRYGVAAVTVALVRAAAEARAQQTNNHVLRAVPPQGQVTLDGGRGAYSVGSPRCRSPVRRSVSNPSPAPVPDRMKQITSKTWVPSAA